PVRRTPRRRLHERAHHLRHDAAEHRRIRLRRRRVRHGHRHGEVHAGHPHGGALTMDNLFGLLVGIAMGFLIQRVRASSPAMIVQNLRLENLSIIKFMATTIAVGMITVYTLNLFIPDLLHFDIKPTYLVGVLAGGLIFGVGFGLGGYCPGTCVVGIGEGRRDAWFALAGGVVGALAFTLAYDALIAPIVAM